MFLKMLIYGRPGIGKTYLLGTGAEDPRLTPAIMIDLEGGLMTIASKVKRYENIAALKKAVAENVELAPINAIRIKSSTDLSQIVNYLYDNNGKHPFKAVYVDSLTEINYLKLQAAAANNPKNTTGFPQLNDYGTSAAQMRSLIRDFRDMDECHVIFTAHYSESKDEQTGRVEIKPSLTGKLVGEVCGMLDIVGLLDMEKDGTRTIRFQPTDRVWAKDRSEGGKLGEVITNATMSQILDALESSQTA